MATGVSVRIQAKQALAALKKMESGLEERTFLTLVGQSLLNWIDRNFRREGLEQRWPPLSMNTIASRRKGSSKPLQDTGRLRQSFTSKVTGNRVEAGTQNQIAEFHHKGTSPYIIRPNKASVLAFRTAEGMRFAKRVRHPGLPARPLVPSDAVTEQIGIRMINSELKRLANEINRGTS